ncbi:MAG TPA: isocitrate lyase/PEP mutase family protein [Opitutaceae bacterium]|nr:isocitrate lyase/PEP mutase family protein [Opitutaceae bacterium]
MNSNPGKELRQALRDGVLPFIGIYDAFSATVAARHYPALFVSGFGFAASYYGLPDTGFVAWADILAFFQRLRLTVPAPHLLVDIDDGFGDTDVACHVASALEAQGASGIVLEDQRRPRRCGHLDGKSVLDLDEYLVKLRRVLAARTDLFVVARTDAAEPDEIVRRLKAFAEAGADAVLADGLRDLALLGEVSRQIQCPLTFNQIAGGKSPPCTVAELGKLGVRLVIYSTPCLFAAQAAIDDALIALKEGGGLLPPNPRVSVASCTKMLKENLRGQEAR